MADGSDAIADWPLLNALVNTARGATWVSIHHGGGVGIGRSIHAGHGVRRRRHASSPAQKLDRVLTTDPGTGVMRHADAGYEQGHGRRGRARREDPDARGAVSVRPITTVGDPVLRRADRRARSRRAALAGDSGADRRPDRDPTLGRRRGARGQPRSRRSKRIAVVEIDARHALRRTSRSFRLTGDRQPARSSRVGDEQLVISEGCLSVPRAARRRASASCDGRRPLSRSQRRGATRSMAGASPPALSSTRSTTSTVCCSSIESPTPRRIRRGTSSSATTRTTFLRSIGPYTRGAGEPGAPGSPLGAIPLVRARVARRRRGPRPACCSRLDGERIVSVTAVSRMPPRGRRAARRASSSRASPTPTRTLPARAARTHAPGARLVLDLARADVRARQCARSRHDARARARHVRRDGARGDHARGRVSLPASRPPTAQPYDDPNAMGDAVIRAAAEAGVRLTLLDACYLHGGSARAGGAAALLRPRRRRVGRAGRAAFRSKGRACGSARRSTASGPSTPSARRSSRAWAAALGAAARARLRAAGRERGVPGGYGATPTACCDRAGALSERFTAVHATHVSERTSRCSGERRRVLLPVPDDRARPRRRNRAGAAAARRRGALALGSDSHAIIEPLEEARAVELDERLASGVRGEHTTASSCCPPRPPPGTRVSAGPRAARSAPARLPTSSPSGSTASGSPGCRSTSCSTRSCSPAPRPTSAT